MGVQVQSATKNGQGESLSILNRQFISFSYGYKKDSDGKDIPVNIEDFDLLAVFSNDRLDKEIYAPFSDTTTEQSELDGQMFWRTSFNAGQLNFSLATDGMTSAQLEDFKNWFQPGIERELILSEYHNRGILARVSAAPQMSLLPFEKEIKVKIGSQEITTKTSLYKGDISLSFIMDDPYWYSIKDIFDNENISAEEAKIIYEDNIPHITMLEIPCFIAGGNYYNLNSNFLESITIGVTEGENNQQKDTYLYYCGTAPAKPFISFNIKPILTKEGYYQYPHLTMLEEELSNAFLKIGGSKLKFSLPSLLTSFNNAVKIIKNYKTGNSILDLRKELRDNIYNYYTRSFVMAIIDYARQNSSYCSDGKLTVNFFNFFLEQLNDFINPESNNLECKINCKTGEVTISTSIKKAELDEENNLTSSYVSITENAGNMIKSNYLNIDMRLLPVNGKIGIDQCLQVSTNTTLENLKIDYKYLYL